jgi:GGDEF domain-containing protein
MTVDFSEALTGLLGRDAFLRLLLHVRSPRTDCGDGFAVLVVDLDGVERLAARLGPDRYETLLAQLSWRLRSALPPDNLATLLRPHAFGLIAFSEASEAAADALAARLHQAIRAPFQVDRLDVFVSASIGVAFSSMRTLPLLAMQHAERAVERVKANGGDATFFYQEHLPLAMELAV